MDRVACESSSKEVFLLLHDATAIVSISSREGFSWCQAEGTGLAWRDAERSDANLGRDLLLQPSITADDRALGRRAERLGFGE